MAAPTLILHIKDLQVFFLHINLLRDAADPDPRGSICAPDPDK
jgi:hypothetical protein